MNLKILLIAALIVLHNTSFGQRRTPRRSYSANVNKIENVKSSYVGCTFGPCYTWWSIALKDSNELLIQRGAHMPAGARSRHFPIGTWKISGDTLKLKITPKSLETDFMRTEYRIVNLYRCEILIPADSSENWNVFLQELQGKFEQSEGYQELRQYRAHERVISRMFNDFVRFDYSAEKKLLVKKDR
jgi:hypothetical protein